MFRLNYIALSRRRNSCQPKQFSCTRRPSPKCVCSILALTLVVGIAQLIHKKVPLLPSEWNDYRISDGILRQYDAPGCETYPTSLVCKYHLEVGSKTLLDLDALMRVLEQIERQNPLWVSHSTDTALVHLRLGDGLCAQHDPLCRGQRTGVPDCWESDEDCFVNPDSVTKQYAFSRRWYRHIFVLLETLRVRHVIIIGDKYHWTRTADPRKGEYGVDDTYVANVASEFRSHHFSVSVREPTTPDEDFVRMCSAKTFVQGGGGYSALIASVVESRGGIVLRPSKGG